MSNARARSPQVCSRGKRRLPLPSSAFSFRMLAVALLAVLVGLGGAAGRLGAQTSPDDLDLSGVDAPGEPADTAAVPAARPAAAGQTRTLLDTVMDGGVVGLIIILLSTISVGFIVEHFLTIRKTVLMPEAFMDELDQCIRQGQLDQALAICQEPHNDCLAAHVVLAGLERFRGSDFGFAEYKAAVEEAGEDQTGRLYRKTEVLGLIGSIAPMLGLLGTVLGMISAFNTIAARGGMARPDELAGGIGEALVTTLLGLIVAIPTMVAFSYFRNKIDSLVAEAGKRIEQILMPLGRRKA